jgi:hypothetical protein
MTAIMSAPGGRQGVTRSGVGPLAGAWRAFNRQVREGWLRPLAIYVKAGLVAARTARAFFGTTPLRCIICRYEGGFLAFGEPLRFDARCPRCGSLERHRLLAVWLAQQPGVARGKRILHLAPEPPVARLLRPLAAEYLAADSDPLKADLVLDVEAISMPAARFDLVVCNHVLEHVDDRSALREIRRVLRPGGTAVLSFPIVEGWETTYENPRATSRGERRRHFGQHDHRRFYGRDARQRIQDAGFEVEEFTAVEPLVSTEGLTRGEKLFIARAV